MSHGSLMLFPRDLSFEAPTLEALTKALGDAGLLGDPMAEEGDFLAGEGFLRQITFMGCSPYIALEPPTDGHGAFCHLRLHGPFAEPQLRWGRNTRPPKCPACGLRISDWRDHLGTHAVHCPSCGATSSLGDCEWRGNAGFGRCFVEVRNIFPGEAAPVEALLRRLEDLGGGPWGWFYVT